MAGDGGILLTRRSQEVCHEKTDLKVFVVVPKGGWARVDAFFFWYGTDFLEFEYDIDFLEFDFINHIV